jgi:hypothetical protein
VTRRPFGGTTADFVEQVDNTGVLHADAGATCTFYSAQTGGIPITDLTDAVGNPITAVSANNYGQIPTFFGPNDGTGQMWVSAGGTSRQLMFATDVAGRVAVIESASGSGAPAIAGAVGDAYWRTDGADGSWLYRCTTAGAAGVAVWTAKL